MPGAHAKLSPSAAKRWLHCPGSVHLSSKVLDSGSREADEGTAGHSVFEAAMRAVSTFGGETPALDIVQDFLGKKVKVDISENAHVEIEITADMVGWVQEAVEWVLAYLGENPGSYVFSEQAVDIGLCFGLPEQPCPNCENSSGYTRRVGMNNDEIVEDCQDHREKTVLWGTSDLFIISPRQGRLVVFDLKLGYGEVLAEDNDQLRMYALGLLNEWYWACCDDVKLVIHQPRNGGAKEATISAEALVEWGREQQPKVHAALDPAAPRVPSDEACQWCRGAALCPELKANAIDVARTEFAEIDTITREDLAEVLGKADLIRTTLKHYEAHALKLLSLGQKIPGWKRVKSKGGHRYWKDEAGAKAAMATLGYDESDYCEPAKLISPARAEKLVGNKELLTEYTEKPEGNPTLAPEMDKRPALPGDFADMHEMIE